MKIEKNEANKVVGSYGSEHLSGFKERIQTLMGLGSAAAFAKKCNIPTSSMQKYLNGSIPGIDKVIKISEATGKSVQWLVTGEEITNKGESIEIPTVGKQSEFDEFVLIPGYSEQALTDSRSIGSDEKIPCRHLAFSKTWLQHKGFQQKELIVLWAKGDSMEPLIGDNNPLIIRTTDKHPTDGNIYVLQLKEQFWVKRIQVTPTGSYLLISDNSIYPPMEIKKENMKNFEVIGKVVHIAKDI